MTCLTCLLLAVLGQSSDEGNAVIRRFHGEFVAIKPGTEPFPASYLMGRAVGGSDQERPVHRVTLGYDFAVAKYEVTQDQWETVMGRNPSRWPGPRNSAEMLSFDEAQEFCRRVTARFRAAGLIGGDREVRLPTEAEWEYVARAGTTGVYSFGDDPAQLERYAWFQGNAAGNDPPVGAKLPNPWGLYDLHGYLWEWCADVAHDSYVGAPDDGSARATGAVSDGRILRGGSWKDPAEQLTSSYRRLAPRTLRDDAVGLRCVLAPVK